MIQRKLYSKLLHALENDKVIVITGMRRVGKTTLILKLYEKIHKSRKLYLDLENPLNQSYFDETDYDKIKLNLENQSQGSGEKFIVFLDEIQNIKKLPSIVKYLYDHSRIKFILTGSASFYLKNLFSESLAGRKQLMELYPLDFEEFLSYKAPNLKKPDDKERVSESTFTAFEKYVFEYQYYGGFPSVVTRESHEEKLAEIDDIFTSYYQKEIRLLSDFRKLDKMKAAMLLLTSRVGSKIDYTKISSELGISRITLEEYIDFLEGTYFLRRIKPFSKRLDVILRGSPKLYLCDNSILNKLGKTPEGVLLENMVFNLMKVDGEVYFYQSKAGAEVDFIIKSGNKYTAIEVKLQAHQTDVNRLKRIAEKLGIKDYYVISGKYAPLNRVIYPFQL